MRSDVEFDVESGRESGPESGEAPGGLAPIRVFLLDDHDGVRQAVRSILEMEPDVVVVGDAGLAARAVCDIPILRPDVAVLDCRLGDGSGVEVCRDVLSSTPGLQVLLLTSLSQREALMSAVMAGATGYLLKGARGQTLAHAVRAAAAGRRLIDEEARREVLDAVRAAADLGHLDAARDLALAELMAGGLTDPALAAETGLDPDAVRARTVRILGALGLVDPPSAP